MKFNETHIYVRLERENESRWRRLDAKACETKLASRRSPRSTRKMGRRKRRKDTCQLKKNVRQNPLLLFVFDDGVEKFLEHLFFNYFILSCNFLISQKSKIHRKTETIPEKTFLFHRQIF